mmetsp:Transcript_39481/g.112738  ORF Transcript_39481/g.112738 Transcript_39481/m.112738 type:complete len:199 (-) Transcript_39481:119-715(-)
MPAAPCVAALAADALALEKSDFPEVQHTLKAPQRRGGARGRRPRPDDALEGWTLCEAENLAADQAPDEEWTLCGGEDARPEPAGAPSEPPKPSYAATVAARLPAAEASAMPASGEPRAAATGHAPEALMGRAASGTHEDRSRSAGGRRAKHAAAGVSKAAPCEHPDAAGSSFDEGFKDSRGRRRAQRAERRRSEDGSC